MNSRLGHTASILGGIIGAIVGSSCYLGGLNFEYHQ